MTRIGKELLEKLGMAWYPQKVDDEEHWMTKDEHSLQCKNETGSVVAGKSAKMGTTDLDLAAMATNQGWHGQAQPRAFLPLAVAPEEQQLGH